MNEFLKRYARQSHESGAAKTFLAIDNADNKTIVGFYSLAPGALAYADTPETVRRGLALHDVPGFRLARTATDLRWQGQGLGASSSPLPRGAAARGGPEHFVIRFQFPLLTGRLSGIFKRSVAGASLLFAGLLESQTSRPDRVW